MMPSNDLFVDTSGWGLILEQNHALHQQALRLYREAAQQQRRMITTNYVINELVALLTSRLHVPRARVLGDIEAIESASHVEIRHISAQTHADAWALLKAHIDKEWSLVDAASFVVMRQLGMLEALTTDHHFEQAGYVRLPMQP